MFKEEARGMWHLFQKDIEQTHSLQVKHVCATK